MASFVGKPIINITHNGGNNFTVRVSYTMRYAPAELAFPEGFADSMALFEEDSDLSLGDDHVVNINTRTFRPRVTEETRTFTFPMTGDELHTEPDGEEIYAVVHHRRNIEGLTSATHKSDVFPIAV